MNLAQTRIAVAVSSTLAFGLQGLLALTLLWGYTPAVVGEFSVISQVAFFWVTLAMAQGPLSWLANAGQSVMTPQQAWLQSLARGLWLLPLALIALWWSAQSVWPALLWVCALAFTQLTWLWAQSSALQSPEPRWQFRLRVLPPLVAWALSLVGIALGAEAPLLLAAALAGYAFGAACWPQARERLALLDAARASPEASEDALDALGGDDRSTLLRLAHTFADAVLATAILVVWQRLYGTAETGALAAVLRLMGFVPALVHLAGAQVALAQAARSGFGGSWGLGLFGFAAVLVMAYAGEWVLEWGALGPAWTGLWTYLAPLALWQGSACLSAALAHRPFQVGAARAYSRACIALASLQGLTLVWPLWGDRPADPSEHVGRLATVSALGLLAMALWLGKFRPVSPRP